MDITTEDPNKLFEEAMKLIGNDDYYVSEPGFMNSDAYKLLLRAAELNHPEAQYLVGKTYCRTSADVFSRMTDDGDELSQQYGDTGWEWYRKSADNGYQRAILIIAEGEYWKKNIDAAREMFLEVVNSNPTDPKTQYDIGFFYWLGRIVDKDLNESVKWHIRAAEQGYSPAMSEAAIAYIRGEGVDQSDELALHYAREGTKHGNSDCMIYLGKHYKYGRAVEKNPKKAFKLFLKALEKGNPLAYIEVGDAYENGVGVEQSYTKAKEIYIKGVEDIEDADCTVALGRLYEKGLGVEQNERRAYELYSQALNGLMELIAIEALTELTEEGSSVAMMALSDYYERSSCHKKPSHE